MEFEEVKSPPIDRLPADIACAVGQIAHKFSEIEQILKEIIYMLSGVDHVVGRIAIGTARAESQITKIEDLMTHRGFAFEPPLAALKTRVSQIESERDAIIHGTWATDPETGNLILVDITGKWNVGSKAPRFTRRMYPLGRPITAQYLNDLHAEIVTPARDALAVYSRVRSLRNTIREQGQPDRPTEDQSQSKPPDQPSPSQKSPQD